MKVKHLLLGIALVALVAACGKKEAAVETPTDTAIETPVEEIEVPAEANFGRHYYSCGQLWLNGSP